MNMFQRLRAHTYPQIPYQEKSWRTIIVEFIIYALSGFSVFFSQITEQRFISSELSKSSHRRGLKWSSRWFLYYGLGIILSILSPPFSIFFCDYFFPSPILKDIKKNESEKKEEQEEQEESDKEEEEPAKKIKFLNIKVTCTTSKKTKKDSTAKFTRILWKNWNFKNSMTFSIICLILTTFLYFPGMYFATFNFFSHLAEYHVDYEQFVEKEIKNQNLERQHDKPKKILINKKNE